VIVLHHSAGRVFELGSRPIGAPLFLWGRFALDAFFVLSGFLLARLTLNNNTPAGGFLLLRFARILPLYWVLTIAFYISQFVMPGRLSGNPTTWQFFVQSMFLSLNQRHPLLFVAWTLQLEAVLYLSLALGLVVRKWANTLLVASAVIIVVAVSTRQWLYLDFILGFASATLAQRRRIDCIRSRWLALACSAGLLVTGGIKLEGVQEVAWFGFLLGCLIYSATFTQLGIPRFLSTLGDAAFSIFLVQVFVFAIVGKIGETLDIPDEIIKFAWSPLMALASVGLGFVIYFGFERRLNAFVLKKIKILINTFRSQ
jgi:peptidoglycan/LPS O-acetylase OafA/YrhL